ncbi:MAG: hypothetical protein KKA90_03105 [Nanoarchaeota archaeon]|nr:hypothetical protein [Nanoarchaeota archaeon]
MKTVIIVLAVLAISAVLFVAFGGAGLNLGKVNPNLFGGDKAPLTKGTRYPLASHVKLYGADMVNEAEVKTILESRATTDDITNLRKLVMRGDLDTTTRATIEKMVGSSYLQNAKDATSVGFAVTGDDGNLVAISVGERDPLRLIVYYLLVSSDKMIVYDPGEDVPVGTRGDLGMGLITPAARPTAVRWVNGAAICGTLNAVPVREHTSIFTTIDLTTDKVKGP